MNISNIFELERLDLIDITFDITEYRDSIQTIKQKSTKASNTPQQTTSNVTVTRFFNLYIVYKWGAYTKDRYSFKLSEKETEIIYNNWPKTTRQLMVVLHLAEANNIWNNIEEKILERYRHSQTYEDLHVKSKGRNPRPQLTKE